MPFRPSFQAAGSDLQASCNVTQHRSEVIDILHSPQKIGSHPQQYEVPSRVDYGERSRQLRTDTSSARSTVRLSQDQDVRYPFCRDLGKRADPETPLLDIIHQPGAASRNFFAGFQKEGERSREATSKKRKKFRLTAIVSLPGHPAERTLTRPCSSASQVPTRRHVRPRLTLHLGLNDPSHLSHPSRPGLRLHRSSPLHFYLQYLVDLNKSTVLNCAQRKVLASLDPTQALS